MNSELEKIILALVRAHGIAKIERHLERLIPRSNWQAWQTVHTYALRLARKERRATKSQANRAGRKPRPAAAPTRKEIQRPYKLTAAEIEERQPPIQ